MWDSLPMPTRVFAVAHIAAVCVWSQTMAGSYPVKHPFHDPRLRPRDADRLTGAVRAVMAMSEVELLALVPVQTAIRFCGCPNCDGGSQESNQFTWSVSRPAEIKCRYCGHVYPSDNYPMDHTQVAANPLGERTVLRYHLDGEGSDYFFDGALWQFQKSWLVAQAYALAKAYHVTREGAYARRAGLIIDRFAELYPSYCVVKQWPYRRRVYTSIKGPPYPGPGGKWGRWRHGEVPQVLPLAYDLIHDSPELVRLSAERGVDVRQRIEEDFFRATVEYVLSFKNHMSNMAPYDARGIIRVGRCIGEPAYMHWAYHWVRKILTSRFFYDGMWCEAPSYHYQTVGGIRMVMGELKGYTDPVGYAGEEGLRLKDVDLGRDLPFLRKALTAPNWLAYPSNRICPVHDSWATSKCKRLADGTGCAIAPGYGHAVLGAGDKGEQMQAHLHFSGSYGHTHRDNLNLAVFAYGREMLCDIGYTHTKLRHWSVSTIGHNLVAVDRAEQSTRQSDGDLLLYVPNLPGLSVVEASGKRGYPKGVEVYRRLLVLVSAPDGPPYLVDLFQVKGGKTHDWLLHGSGDHDQTAECSLPLSPRPGSMLEPGEKWVEPKGESSKFNPYGLIRRVKAGKADGPWRVTLRYVDRPDLGCRIHALDIGSVEVFLGDVPAIRKAGRDDRQVYEHVMPQIVTRRRGTPPLDSLFVRVIEPFHGDPVIERVEPLPSETAADDAFALRVHLPGRIDTVAVRMDEPAGPSEFAGVRLDGRVGVAIEREGRVSAGYLIGGTRFSAGSLDLAAECAGLAGTISAATRRADGDDTDAFLTPAEVPVGSKLRGAWMVVTHGNGFRHGYEIDHVDREGDVTRIHLRQDHGLRVHGGRTTEVFFPQRRIQGVNRFAIPGAVWVGARE